LEDIRFHLLFVAEEFIEEGEERIVECRWKIAVTVIADLNEPMVVGYTERLIHSVSSVFLSKES
jgi:hypothetical protein